MKMIPFIIALFVSCSNVPMKAEHEYMTHDEIVKKMTVFNEEDYQSQFGQSLNADKLVPLSIFIEGKEEMKYQKPSFRGEIKTLPSSTDLTKWSTSIKDQNGPRCTAWALVKTMEVLINKNNLYKNPNLSEMDTFNQYNKYSCVSAMDAIHKNKKQVTDEEYWPSKSDKPFLDKREPHIYISEAEYIGSDVKMAKYYLANNYPLYIGIRVMQDMANCKAVISPSSVGIDGGHALPVLGYRDDASITGGGYFIVENSWSSSCGDKGRQYLPYSFFEREDFYPIIYAIKNVKTTKNPNPTPTPNPTPSKKKVCLEMKDVLLFGLFKICEKCTKWQEE